MTAATAGTDARVLQERMAEFVRRFGLHRPDETPCGVQASVSEAHVVAELASGPHSQQALARRVYLDKSTVSRVVDGLERRRWVRRRTDVDDGRMVRVELTETGRKAAVQLNEARSAKFARLLDVIPTQDRAGVLAALDRLISALDATT